MRISLVAFELSTNPNKNDCPYAAITCTEGKSPTHAEVSVIT